ncbi:MAG: nicotinate (nicotinamide) nucleotide adenylyltransferase [Clostridia bacterium]|nr:nicotinate (nicotinamide) nucleotide adenylyltransferase [Clostridia bacterium]
MRIGFFGGSFDPFHIEHKEIIKNCKEFLNLDKVVVYPSFNPPHKTNTTSFDVRFEMVKEGTKDLEYVIVSDIENKRQKVNPTCEIIPLLKQEYLADEYFFLMGEDSLKQFKTWINPANIVKEINLAVVSRTGIEDDINKLSKDIEDTYDTKIKVIPYTGKEISSSVIKAKIELDLPIEEIPEEVKAVITKHNLYKTHTEIIQKLKSMISPKRYNHSVNVTICALKLNARFMLPYEKVFLSGLLHDCAKERDYQMEGVPSPVVHQFTGAIVANKEFGIEDADILNAIKYHTTGKPDMTQLEKLIFCADMIEESRNFEGVELLREEINKDFDIGFLKCVEGMLNSLKTKEKDIYYLTLDCAKFYNIL